MREITDGIPLRNLLPPAGGDGGRLVSGTEALIGQRRRTVASSRAAGEARLPDKDAKYSQRPGGQSRRLKTGRRG